MEVTCENCNKTFNSSNIKVKERYIGAMITETYYNCPHCDKKYIVCLKNFKIRRLIRKLNKLKARLNSEMSFDFKPKLTSIDRKKAQKRLVLSNKIDDIIKEIQTEMNRINGK